MSSTNSHTRTRILNAALDLLESGAPGGVRISDIARASGISRQALYLHFPTRADLLVAAVRHLDQAKDVDARLAASRAAGSGPDRLDRFIEAWGGYIPEIHGIGAALMAMMGTDEAARQAWEDRMQAVRHGCAAAVAAIEADGLLAGDLDAGRATDLLWALLSVPTWQQLTRACGWTQEAYVAQMKRLARAALMGPTGGGP